MGNEALFIGGCRLKTESRRFGIGGTSSVISMYLFLNIQETIIQVQGPYQDINCFRVLPNLDSNKICTFFRCEKQIISINFAQNKLYG